MKIKIRGESIKLGQLLKKVGKIDTGGKARKYLEVHEIKVNGQKVITRGHRVMPKDVVWIDDDLFMIESDEENS